jgi:hypothetical protein
VRPLGAALPFAAFVLLLAALRPRVDSWRHGIVTAAVMWGTGVAVVTEALSLVHAFTFFGALVLWGAAVVFLGWAVSRGPALNPLRALCESRALSRRPRAVLLAVGGIVATVGVVAVVAPPNTYDSMTYHMSRVAHWIQNGDVRHYPTYIVRQNSAAPGAEFIIANIQVLAGSDRLANLVQWASMIGSLAGVSLVTRLLGSDRRAQLLTVIVAATIPMGVLQASSTQNDYVVALWLVCLAVFVLRPAHPTLVGAALGLLLLTKPTGYVFALPLIVWFAVSSIAHEHRVAWRRLALVVLVALALNAGYFVRNIATFGAPLGPGSEGQHGEYQYINGTIGVKPMLSVALRNLAVHLGTPWPRVNAMTEGAVGAAHRLLRLDVNDPRTTWFTTEFRVLPPSTHEDSAANGVHLVLIVVAIVVSITWQRRRPIAWSLVIAFGFLLFSAVFRWQPWHSRLELPLFVLAAPLVGMALAPRRIGPAVAVALLLLALDPLLWNATRPLVGPRNIFQEDREAQYFVTRPDLQPPYRAAIERARALGCADIGLMFAGSEPEYPFWVLAKSALGERVRLEHVFWNATSPCVVFTTLPTLPEEIDVAGRVYRRDLVAPPISLFVPRQPSY